MIHILKSALEKIPRDKKGQISKVRSVRKLHKQLITMIANFEQADNYNKLEVSNRKLSAVSLHCS